MDKVAPEAYRKVLDLNAYAETNVDSTLLELVKLRASMINGCAFCVDMHSTDATRAGENPRRLFALSAWTESSFFSREERAALALTDAVTKIDEAGVPDEVWDEARGLLREGGRGHRDSRHHDERLQPDRHQHSPDPHIGRVSTTLRLLERLSAPERAVSRSPMTA
jgi:AhpD family alkylhydroperoxidase